MDDSVVVPVPVKPLVLPYLRNFGVEMEVNASDRRDFKMNPLHGSENPLGADVLLRMIQELGFSCQYTGWGYTKNNKQWVLKPDRSCGMELCSPVSKNWGGLKNILQVAHALKQANWAIDNRCSLHLHVELPPDSTGNNLSEVSKVLMYWVKCESVFLDSVPLQRKQNRYCQCIGMLDMFEHDTPFSEHLITERMRMKYLTANCYHLMRGERNTIEFRIAEFSACSDPFFIKNWVKLLLHFVEMARQAPIPGAYERGNNLTGFVWMDLMDVIQFLKMDGSRPLSRGLEQVRNWFLARIHKSLMEGSEKPRGMWSAEGRKAAVQQLDRVLNQLGLKDNIASCLEDSGNTMYHDEYVN